MSEFAHQSGAPISCICMALKIRREEVDKIGMRIGGGIDQDFRKSIYNDNVCEFYINKIKNKF
jgi:hypothetical protein